MRAYRTLYAASSLLILALSLGGCVGPAGSPPVAAFSYHPHGGEVPLTVTFDASDSYDLDGQIREYRWNFGDGTYATGMVVSHRFTVEGTYQVVLTVTDEDGLTGRTAAELQVGISYPLDVVSWEIRDTNWGIAVEGRVRNIGQRPIAIGRIAVRFFSATGEYLGEISTLVYDVAPGEEREFGLNSSLQPYQINPELTEIYTEVLHADDNAAGG